MVYIDFDGVILDTEGLLFEEWRKIPNRHLLTEQDKIEYIKKRDWQHIVNDSKIINNSVDYLKEMNPKETFILTKVHSLEEAKAKTVWIRNKGIKQNLILVPYYCKKTDIVDPDGNILVDDCLYNLYDWEDKQGVPILFDIDSDEYDSWNQPNAKGYKRVLSLASFIN